MSKRIVVCFDGTGQRGDLRTTADSDTNVVKLSRSLKNHASDAQLCEYIAGIGSSGPKPKRAIPGLTGLGFTRNVEASYRFIVKHYRPDDEIFLFGYSRGAFTARTLAEIVGFTGILAPEEIDNFKKVLRLFVDPSSSWARQIRKFLRTLPHARGEDRQPLQIHMLGVWDTVAALGAPPQSAPRLNAMLRHWAERQRRPLPPHISHARHALALHELRPDFEPVLWTGLSVPLAQSLKQCWFAGNHADVGGGYRESSLSDTSLRWMAEEAKKLGLAFKAGHEPATIAIRSTMGGVHNEMTGVQLSLGNPTIRSALLPQDPGAKPAGHAASTFVHASALQRVKQLDYYTYRAWSPESRRIAKANMEVDELTMPFFLHHYFMQGNPLEH